MPLPVLLTLVIGGITAIAVILHVLGRSAPRPLVDDDDARRQWLRHFPEDRITHVQRCASGQAALIGTKAGPGLLWSFGADTTARRLSGAKTQVTGWGLDIRLPDFTAPRVKVRMPHAEARTWAEDITP